MTFQFELIKNKKIAWPRYEDNDFIMVAGSVRPLLDAFRIAHVEMVLWLESEYGFERWEALEVLSQVGVARIANVVDPNFTVMAKFPKKACPEDERGQPKGRVAQAFRPARGPRLAALKRAALPPAGPPTQVPGENSHYNESWRHRRCAGGEPARFRQEFGVGCGGRGRGHPAV